MMLDYNEFISRILETSDFMLAGELNARLQSQFQVTAEHARKIIERAVKRGVAKSSLISFGRGQLAYVHLSKEFTREIITSIAEEKRPALYRLIKMLKAQDGILPYQEAMKICATPLEPQGAKSDPIVKLLKEMTILKYGIFHQTDDGQRFIIDPEKLDEAPILCRRAVTKMSVDAAFMPDVLRALKRYNIIDNEKARYRNKATPYLWIGHNNYLWDAMAYTRSTGINHLYSPEAITIDKQTLVVIDIVVSRDYSYHDVKGFLSRIQGVLGSVKEGKRKVLPIVVYAKPETKEVSNLIRRLGFICFDVGSIYGARVYDVIRNMVVVKSRRSLEIEKEAGESFEEIAGETLRIIRAAGQEDNLSNIKGDLFEFLLFPLIKVVFPDADITHGMKVKVEEDGKEKEYEFDFIVYSSRLREVVVIELKGKSPKNRIPLGTYEQRDTLKWFFNRTFQIARSDIEKRYPGFKVSCCFITSSKFYQDGISYLESINKPKIKPSLLDIWYDGKKLLALLERERLIKPKALIERYYLKSAESDGYENDPPATSGDAGETV